MFPLNNPSACLVLLPAVALLLLPSNTAFPLAQEDQNTEESQNDAYGCETPNDTPSSPNLSTKNGAVSTWPGGIIPYMISAEITDRVRLIVEQAIKDINQLTCVKFVENDGQTDFLEIVPGEENRCYGRSSNIGKNWNGGRQTVQLSQQAGCPPYSLVLHELMHVLGFRHEQTRTDRDDFIQLLVQNVQDFGCITNSPGGALSIDPMTVHTMMDETYDYCSVMHYHAWSCSKNGKKTMRAIKPNQCEPLGSAKSLSESDIRRINKLYPDGLCLDELEESSGESETTTLKTTSQTGTTPKTGTTTSQTGTETSTSESTTDPWDTQTTPASRSRGSTTSTTQTSEDFSCQDTSETQPIAAGKNYKHDLESVNVGDKFRVRINLAYTIAPNPLKHRFSFIFYTPEGGRVFQFEVRLGGPDHFYKRNSYVSNSALIDPDKGHAVWGEEIWGHGKFPFTLGATHTVLFEVQADKFVVSVDCEKLTEFRHRAPIDEISRFVIRPNSDKNPVPSITIETVAVSSDN